MIFPRLLVNSWKICNLFTVIFEALSDTKQKKNVEEKSFETHYSVCQHLFILIFVLR